MSDSISSQAKMAVPAWLGGGEPERFLSDAGLRVRRVPGQSDQWFVQTEESYTRTKPSPITVDHLAGPSVTRNRFDYLAEIAPSELPIAGLTIENDIVRARLAEMQRRGALVDACSFWRIQISTVLPQDVRNVVVSAYDELRSISLEGDPERKVFANSGIHLVRQRLSQVHRSKFPSFALRVKHDLDLLNGDTGHLQSAIGRGETVFASSEALGTGFYLLDAYLGPLLGCLSPFVWAFSCTRALGVIIFSLGQPISGASGEAAEMLQLLNQHGASKSVSIPILSPNSSSVAIQWWIDRLSGLFAVLGDPAVFQDADGIYDPVKHLRALATVEQLFRRISSIQTAHRDTNARHVLFFSVLDTLYGLTNRNILKNCNLTSATKVLDRLRAEIPDVAQEVLLPAAERGVNALRELQDGFFLGRDDQSGTIDLVHSDGQIERMDLEKAAACYVEMRRNSTHGVGTNRQALAGRVTALLAQHRGHLSQDLGLLGYLYLLDILAMSPDVLRRILRTTF